jgi:peptide/nickel transport system ATP-binding protein
MTAPTGRVDSTGEVLPALRVEDLSVYFDTERGWVRAVDGVSFDIPMGQTLGIVGESGSGKSVLSRAVMQLLPSTAHVPESAVVSFRGRQAGSLTRRAARHFWGVEVAMVFQDPMTSLTPVVKIGRQITEPLRYHLGLSRRAARERAVELLDSVGIPEPARRLHEYPHSLSGGMRQRVTIAIALACEPTLLIADEPTTALDVTIQKQILNLLQSVQRERSMSMILVTHDLGVVANRTDQIAVMYAGRIVERAPTARLFTAMRHPYTRALMNSIPRLDQPSHTRLETIAGRPPLVIDPPPGCRFAPRCPNVQPRCRVETPALEARDHADHEFACFYPVEVPVAPPAAFAAP